MTRMTLPLFPLHTVLFPQGRLALRVFEVRYIDMVRRCLREDSPFGVSLILEGDEVGGWAEPHGVGTVARILDCGDRADGLLGIYTQGESRFRILEQRRQPDGLVMADVELLADPDQPVDGLQSLSRLLKNMLEAVPERYSVPVQRQLENPAWVAYRLAELLPLRLEERQALLESDHPLQLLEQLRRHLERFGLLKEPLSES